jgi:hypothetical protein
MSIPTSAPANIARLLSVDTPAYHFEIPGDIASIATYIIPTDTIVYISANKQIDAEYNCIASWSPKHGLADVLFFNEHCEEFEGYINFELMWQNSIFIDD